MRYRITWRPQAREEFDEAYDWHENERPGLGEDFAQQVDEVLTMLKKYPKVHAKEYGNVRKAVLKKFQYTIYYYVEARTVVVLSVFHQKRNPENWKARI